MRRLGLGKRWLTPFLDDPLRRAALAHADLRFVPGAARASLLVTAEAVHEDFAAVEDRDVLGLAELPPAAVTLRGAGVPLGDAREAIRGALFRYAGVNAARAVGCARAAFEHARRYAEERTAFGKPVGHFQAIAFLLADMATEIDAARALTWRACRASDLGASDVDLRLAQAAAQAREMLAFVTSNAAPDKGPPRHSCEGGRGGSCEGGRRGGERVAAFRRKHAGGALPARLARCPRARSWGS